MAKLPMSPPVGCPPTPIPAKTLVLIDLRRERGSERTAAEKLAGLPGADPIDVQWAARDKAQNARNEMRCQWFEKWSDRQGPKGFRLPWWRKNWSDLQARIAKCRCRGGLWQNKLIHGIGDLY